ncbi:MAG: hypothetical protein IT426_14685 [Pirellulales bacterium]|nr:hypothetical protein [Pirellulales bacterium]
MKTIAIFWLTLAFFAVAWDAQAQMFTPRSSSSSMGNSGLGSMGIGSTGMGSMGIGSTGMGMGSMGMGSMGTGMGMGSMGTGMGMGGTGMGGMSGLGGMTNRQNSGFIGANTNANQFIGANQSGMQGMGMNRQNFGGMSQFGMGGRMGQNQFGMGMNNAFGMQNNQRQQLVTASRLAFEVPLRASAAVSTSMNRRLLEAWGNRSLSPLQASLQGRTLILKGTVATEHDKSLAEKMMLLEPGIDRVQNELVVGAPDTAGPKSSPN